MFRKIWNTLRHGERRTKAFLIFMFILFLAVVGFAVLAFVEQSVVLAVASGAAVVIALVMAKNVALVVKEHSGENRKKRSGFRKKEDEKKQWAEEMPFSEIDAMELEENVPEEGILQTMNQATLKKLLVRYKVKQSHVPVVIDLCISERVRQAPGFAWVSDGMLKILVVERLPRLIERPVKNLQSLEVERGISVRASEEYTELRQSELMKKMFTPYLPRYHKKEIGGRTILLKNLYVLDGDIKFSSGSVNELKKLLPLRVELVLRKGQGAGFSAYYKEVFTASFLWQDGIYGLREYQGEVERVLCAMAEADISYNEFEGNLSEMITSGLLPSEYRKFAYAKRKESKKAEGIGKPKDKRIF